MRHDPRRRVRRAAARCLIAALAMASTTAAQATPIVYQFSGTGSGTVNGVPFTDAAYVIRAAGDTEAVQFSSGASLGHPQRTAWSVPVTVTIDIAGVGGAILARAGRVVSTGPELWLSVSPPLAYLIRTVEYSSLVFAGYNLGAFAPRVLQDPLSLDFVAQPSDLGPISLESTAAVTFEAITTCGNGIVEAEEACDDGNARTDDCCQPSCAFSLPTQMCRNRSLSNSCDAPEYCTGTSGTCPADLPVADGTTCYASPVCSVGVGTCAAGVCQVAPRDCDDLNPCTEDTCDLTLGCVHAPVADGTTCPSSAICSAAVGACAAGVCQAGPRDCADLDPCTRDACDLTLGCVHADGPASGCLPASQSSLRLTPGSPAGTAVLSWRWAKGAALTRADLGDPTVDADYDLCVWSGAANTPVADAVFAAGAQWSSVGTSGFRYSARHPSTVARLSSGAAGRSSAIAKGRGVTLRQPLPEVAPLTVQLQRKGSPLCLEARFAAPRRSGAGLRAQFP